MNMNKLLKSSIDVTGKIPLVLKNKLESAGVLVDGLITGGNDIAVTLNSKGTETNVEATFVGNGKWVVDVLEDNANLFPEIEEGDSVSVDMFTKLFMNSINSGLILSFNPLGEVKYGIKDKIDNLKEKKQRLSDWANNKLYAEDAEKWIRANGPYRRTFTDARDGQTRTKRDYSAGRINVGKLQQLSDEGKGHYKVLTGNPATQDFQVWHLYKNGNKIRCLDLKTGLQPQEAQWVYDNNIPDTWSEADWNPEGDIPEKANQIEVGQGDVEESQEEDNVTDSQEETVDTNEEDNVTEEPQEEESDIHDFVVDYYNDEEDNIDDWWDDSENGDEWNLDTDIVQMDEEDNVAEEPKKKKTKKKVASAFIKSSDEEDNVIESKPRKKSKYNGKNVTGYQDGMLGTMTTASWIKQNLAHFHKAMGKKDIKGEPEKQFNSVMDKLKNIISLNPKLALEMTKNSNENLVLDFGVVPGLNSKYAITLDFTDKGVLISGSGVPEGGKTPEEINANKLKFTLDLMDKAIETISGTKPVNRKP